MQASSLLLSCCLPVHASTSIADVQTVSPRPDRQRSSCGTPPAGGVFPWDRRRPRLHPSRAITNLEPGHLRCGGGFYLSQCSVAQILYRDGIKLSSCLFLSESHPTASCVDTKAKACRRGRLRSQEKQSVDTVIFMLHVHP